MASKNNTLVVYFVLFYMLFILSLFFHLRNLVSWLYSDGFLRMEQNVYAIVTIIFISYYYLWKIWINKLFFSYYRMTPHEIKNLYCWYFFVINCVLLLPHQKLFLCESSGKWMLFFQLKITNLKFIILAKYTPLTTTQQYNKQINYVILIVNLPVFALSIFLKT